MGDGKFFEIRSRLSDYVLTIDDDSARSGQRVLLQRSKNRKGQLWYEDHRAGRIRSFLDDDLVLQFEDDHMIVNEYHMDEYNQKWKVSDDVIRHEEDNDNVLDVAYSSKDEDTDVLMWNYHGDDNQRWEFVRTGKKYFFIKSMMHGKVVDIDHGRTEPGTEILMWDSDPNYIPNQLWWEDEWGNIRSKLNDFVFTGEQEKPLYMQEYDSGNVDALWARSGKIIYNKGDPDLCMDILYGNADDGTRITKWPYSGIPNQHWQLEYID